MVHTKPLVSIIVPFYNTGKYIGKCINSLINQSYRNLQIILVNDGSTDESLQVCHGFAKKDGRLLVIDKESGGVSSARNLGMEHARGEFISFVDSDDWLELNMYEYLVDNILKYNTDAAMFEYFVEYDDRTIVHSHSGFNEIINGEQAIMATISPVNRFAWSKLFSKELIEDAKFDLNIAIGEDTLFSCEVLKNANKVYFTNTPLYHYWQSSGSTTRSGFNSKYFTVIDVYTYLVALTSDMSYETQFTAMLALSNFLEMNLFGIYSMNMTTEKERARRYLKQLRSYCFNILINKNVDSKNKIKLALCALNPFIYSKLYKKYRLFSRNI